jgi:hypothetical protein
LDEIDQFEAVSISVFRRAKGVMEWESVRELLLTGHRPEKIAQHALNSAADLAIDGTKNGSRTDSLSITGKQQHDR